MGASAGLDRLLRGPRRAVLLATVAGITLAYTWLSINRLSALVDVQAVDVGRSTLLELAEQNIASHLHLSQNLERVAGAPAAPAAAVARSAGGVRRRLPLGGGGGCNK